MLALLAGVSAYFASVELPEIDPLAQTSYICMADVAEGCTPENAMAKLQGKDTENRTNVRLDELPEHVVNAVIAVEDRDFFEHRGVNPMSIGRALYRDLRGDGVQQGGSTITQQFVKNAFLGSERSLSRKVKEAVLSLKLEQRMSKEEILEGYLNKIYFGRNAHGVAAASHAYFGKDVREIGLAEAAFLAGVIRAPELAEPEKHPEEAARRRKTALVAMQEEGYITAEQAAEADAVPLEEPHLRPRRELKLIDTLKGADWGTPYITFYVKHELRQLGYSDEQIEAGGLRVYTSIDPEMQKAAWEAVTSTLTDPDDPEAALVAVDNQGLVRAMVGSRHPYEAGVHENNYAVRGLGSSGRQTGSTFKVFALAAALRDGYSLDSRFEAPAKYETDWINGDTGEPWVVSNYDPTGPEKVLDLYDATKTSSNTVYAQLILKLGAQSVADLAERLGVTGGEELAPNPSIVLGSSESTPIEMAGAYSTFANRGEYIEPDIITRVEQVDQDGNTSVLYERTANKQVIFPQSVADKVNHTLQGVIKEGTGTGADIGKPAAGKTGTAQANRDAWFAGYTPTLTAVVWMGYPEGQITMENVQGVRTVTGGSLPATIWRKFMSVATGDSVDAFVDVSPEDLRAGEVINSELLTTEEQATTTTIEEPPEPDTTTTVPGRRGRGRGPNWPTTSSTTEPPDDPPDEDPPDDGSGDRPGRPTWPPTSQTHTGQ